MGLLLDRYHAGDCQAVWQELLAQGGGMQPSPDFLDAEEIANETMRRAKANVKTILTRIPEIGYHLKFSLHAPAGSISAYSEPSAEVESEILNFEKTVGPIPLSIKAWYRQIGTVNLCWDQEAEAPFPQDWARLIAGSEFYLDPLVVHPPDYTLNEVQSDETIVGEDGVVRFAVSMSPDFYHKDETSGGSPYCFALPDNSCDTAVLYEPHGITFVEYLRTVFEWGGFPGFERLGTERPATLRYLCEGMIPL